MTAKEYCEKWGHKLGTYLYEKEINMQRDKNYEKLLVNTWIDEDIEIRRDKCIKKGLAYCVVIGTGLIFWAIVFIFMFKGCATASTVVKVNNIEGYSEQEWCNAIYWAEGGNNTKHPYGILAKYKHTSPRQACINTVTHKWRDYSKLPYKTRQRKRFLVYLQERYAPINASNDPGGLNKNWIKNVKWYLEHPKEVK